MGEGPAALSLRATTWSLQHCRWKLWPHDREQLEGCVGAEADDDEDEDDEPPSPSMHREHVHARAADIELVDASNLPPRDDTDADWCGGGSKVTSWLVSGCSGAESVADVAAMLGSCRWLGCSPSWRLRWACQSCCW